MAFYSIIIEYIPHFKHRHSTFEMILHIQLVSKTQLPKGEYQGCLLGVFYSTYSLCASEAHFLVKKKTFQNRPWTCPFVFSKEWDNLKTFPHVLQVHQGCQLPWLHPSHIYQRLGVWVSFEHCFEEWNACEKNHFVSLDTLILTCQGDISEVIICPKLTKRFSCVILEIILPQTWLLTVHTRFWFCPLAGLHLICIWFGFGYDYGYDPKALLRDCLMASRNHQKK